MTKLEIVLIIALVYIIIGFFNYWYSDVKLFAGASERDEKFKALCDILLWPFDIVRIFLDTFIW